MFGWLSKLYNWITGFWKALPEPIKEKIIDAIIESFEIFLRAFYKNQKGNSSV
jgi:hypothetical protein